MQELSPAHARKALITALFCALPIALSHGALPARLADGSALPSLAPMLESVNPSVVNIATYTTVQVRNPLLEDPFFRRFFDVRPRTRRTQSAGSGVVVDAARGYIVTNHHVVDRADEINVGLADGRVLEATLVGRDPQVDLAVLKVEPEALQQIEFGDSADLRQGDFVVAIGNPFGLNQTVTSGIVSALGRSGLGIEGFEDFIQTDAPINPGNSGGALVDLAGRLVGINTAIFAPSGGNVGIGFAIPSNMVRAVMNQLIEFGEVRRGYPGMDVQRLTPDLAEAFGVKHSEGVVVVEVDPDSPASRAGLKPGDVIVKVGERVIRRPSDYESRAAVIFAGEDVSMEILRDGRRKSVRLAIDAENADSVAGRRVHADLKGVVLQNFRNEDEPNTSAGVLITSVAEGSKAYVHGLRAGDVLVAANRRPVRNIVDLREATSKARRELLLRVYRAGEFGYVVIR